MQPRMVRRLKRGARALVWLAISATALGAPGAAWAGNLITNGDFTSYTSTAPMNQPSQIVSVDTAGNPGYTTLTGWTSEPSISGSVYNYTFLYTGRGDTNGSYYPAGGTQTYIWGPALGVNNGLTTPPTGNYLAMDGGSAVNSNLDQTVSGLTIGGTYQLSFNWAAAEFYAYSGDTTEQFNVTFGGVMQSTSTFSNTPGGFSGWMVATMYFTANATSETLSFLSVGAPDSLPPCALLADVSMQSVPEPSSLVLVGIGLLGGIAVRLVRRRARSVAV